LKKSKAAYEQKVAPAALLQKNLGNCYCASLYAGLVSLMSEKSDELVGKRILLFSYGSGLAASLFSIKVDSLISPLVERVNLKNRLAQRVAVPPKDFHATLKSKEDRFGLPNYTPVDAIENLFPGTYYLVEIDPKYRRSYQRKSKPAL